MTTWMFDAAHKYTQGIYDLVVDTSPSPLTSNECALQIKRCLSEGPPPTAMRWLKVWIDPAKHRSWIRGRMDAMS